MAFFMMKCLREVKLNKGIGNWTHDRKPFSKVTFGEKTEGSEGAGHVTT